MGDLFFELKFTNVAPGAPMPDLLQLLSSPQAGQALEFIQFNAHATGTLRKAFGVPDGTPGRAEVVETAPEPVLVRNFHGGDFPAELINLTRVGQ